MTDENGQAAAVPGEGTQQAGSVPETQASGTQNAPVSTQTQGLIGSVPVVPASTDAGSSVPGTA